MPFYAMVMLAMRLVLAFYSPAKGKVTTLALSANRIIHDFGQQVLDTMVQYEWVTVTEGRVIPTRGGREALDELMTTRQLEGAKSAEELEKDIDRRLDRQFRDRLQRIHLFA